MSLVAIDSQRNVRKTLLLTHDEAAEVEDFRVSELVRRALAQWREEQQAKERSK
jgi:hypothetical protein